MPRAQADLCSMRRLYILERKERLPFVINYRVVVIFDRHGMSNCVMWFLYLVFLLYDYAPTARLRCVLLDASLNILII